jgi:hypothetical protein
MSIWGFWNFWVQCREFVIAMMEMNHVLSASESPENELSTYEPDEGDAVLPGRVSREQSTRGGLCDDGDACNTG